MDESLSDVVVNQQTLWNGDIVILASSWVRLISDESPFETLDERLLCTMRI
jgi:hypothetical protein